MNRRQFLASSSAAALPRMMRGAARRPLNVVVVLIDDLGASTIGCYGNREHRTPHIDKLASTGVRFQTCYATPLCSPSRVEAMTGRYAFRTGWYNLIGRSHTPSDHLDPNEQTFADVLKTRGYRTALAGKWQLGDIEKRPRMIFENGFDEYMAWAWPLRPRYWKPEIIENGQRVATTAQQYGPDMQAAWMDAFIRRNRNQPFLLYNPAVLVHAPYEPTPDPADPGRKVEGSLKAYVAYQDHLVGRLIRTLEETGLRENTVVLVAGDNGTAGNGKGQVTELGARVPMIANCPGLIGEGKVLDDLIDFSDVLPTLAELAGAVLPEGVKIDGRSFAPQLLGRKGNPRDWIFSYLRDQRVLRDRRWLLEGDGKFYDCGDRRDGEGYKDVTNSREPDALAARKRFDEILRELPAPPPAEGDERPRDRKKRR